MALRLPRLSALSKKVTLLFPFSPPPPLFLFFFLNFFHHPTSSFSGG